MKDEPRFPRITKLIDLVMDVVPLVVIVLLLVGLALLFRGCDAGLDERVEKLERKAVDVQPELEADFIQLIELLKPIKERAIED